MYYRFRRDDSRSKIIDEVQEENENGAEAEAKREQLKALWKTRNKNKKRIEGTDEDSLSQLIVLEGGEKSRSHDIRRRLEISCRSGSRESCFAHESKNPGKGVKRSAAEGSDAPEWIKQKMCLERRQQKRQCAISVANWTYETSRQVRKRQGAKQSKGRPNVSLGASCLIRKDRTVRTQEGLSTGRSSTGTAIPPRSNRSSGPTSFKGLLSFLGQQAQMDS